HHQHAEDQRQADGEQHIDRAERKPGEQLHGEKVECQTGHRMLQKTVRATMARTVPLTTWGQALWPSASQDRRFASFGSSTASTLNTSSGPFSGFDFDSMMSTDCTA